MFQTAGEPPSIGSTNLVSMGSTRNTRAAPEKATAANSAGASSMPRLGVPTKVKDSSLFRPVVMLIAMHPD